MKPDRYAHLYAACFSKVPDHKSQWIEYADNGQGAVIEFNPDAFDFDPPGFQRGFHLVEVSYDEDEQRKRANDILKEIIEKSHFNFLMPSLLAAINAGFAATRFKNPQFRDEHETRLVFNADPKDKLRFRVRGQKHLVPYIEFPVLPVASPIRGIALEPRSSTEANFIAVRMLLEKHGFDVSKIGFGGSKLPLRLDY